MMRGACVAVLALGAATLAASCRQLGDIEERAACEGASESPSACSTCLSRSCCDGLVTCRNEARCDGLQACLADCAPDAHDCRAKCREQHGAGLREPFAPLATCAASACSADCGPTWGLVYPNVACAGCGAQHCGDLAAACAASGDCVALLYCSWPCRGAACRGECERLHPAGTVLARTLGECLAADCSEDCGYQGPDFSCLGETPTKPGPGPNVEVELTLGTFEKFEPAIGVLVRACTTTDIDECQKNPLLSGSTDDAGQLTLELPHGFDGYFFTEHDQTVPTIHYVVRPVVQSKKFSWELLPSQLPENSLPLVGPLDFALGQLTIDAIDCASNPLSGASFALDAWGPKTLPFYDVFGLGAGSSTPGNGHGGFLNVPPGLVEVRVVRRDTGECIAQRTLISRAGTHTEAGPLFPGPCTKPAAE